MLSSQSEKDNSFIFEISTAYVWVQLGTGHTTFGLKNLHPVWSGKLKNGFQKKVFALNSGTFGIIFKY